MEFETVIYEKDEDLAWIKLNRPHVLNAVGVQLAKDFMDAFDIAR